MLLSASGQCEGRHCDADCGELAREPERLDADPGLQTGMHALVLETAAFPSK